MAGLGLLIGAAGAVSALEIVSNSAAFAAPFFFALLGWFLWPAIAGVELGIRWVTVRRS